MNWEDAWFVEKRRKVPAIAVHLPWRKVVDYQSLRRGLLTRWRLRDVPWSEVDAPRVTSDGRKLRGNCLGSKPDTLKYTFKYLDGITYFLQPIFVPSWRQGLMQTLQKQEIHEREEN